MGRYIYLLLFINLSFRAVAQDNEAPYILVLGVSQDGGYPHMGCHKPCCLAAWADESMRRYVVSLALVDPASHQWWLFEATPDIKQQLHYFEALTKGQYGFLPAGVFVTHAHIGHYTGLMEFGREVMGTHELPVYALARMKSYIENNGPWSQLVSLHNIALQPLQADSLTHLTGSISVRAFTVPHRDEYSETAGFEIITPGKKYLFIPDINKWEKWDRSIVNEVKAVDVAMVDATFYDNTELPARNFTVVPHPFVTETMQLFDKEKPETKAKVYFIHFNHTNPLLRDKGAQHAVEKAGFNFARQGQRL